MGQSPPLPPDWRPPRRPALRGPPARACSGLNSRTVSPPAPTMSTASLRSTLLPLPSKGCDLTSPKDGPPPCPRLSPRRAPPGVHVRARFSTSSEARRGGIERVSTYSVLLSPVH